MILCVPYIPKIFCTDRFISYMEFPSKCGDLEMGKFYLKIEDLAKQPVTKVRGQKGPLEYPSKEVELLLGVHVEIGRDTRVVQGVLEGTVIEHDGSKIDLNDLHVSRTHGIIEFVRKDPPLITYEDQSKNGTFYNGENINLVTVNLNIGDTLGFGQNIPDRGVYSNNIRYRITLIKKEE